MVPNTPKGTVKKEGSMSYQTKISDPQIEANYNQAKERYAELGVNVDVALDKALNLPISLHCW